MKVPLVQPNSTVNLFVLEINYLMNLQKLVIVKKKKKKKKIKLLK
jgi:hypothetical protein